MKRHPIILTLLLLAHVVLDLVAWRLAEQQPVGSPAQIVLIDHRSFCKEAIYCYF